MKSLLSNLSLFFIFIIYSHTAFAQDSIQQLLRTTKEDSTRVLLLFQLSNELCRSEPEKAFALSQQGLQLARKINYSKGELYCKVSLGWCWWSIGDYSTAIQLMLTEMKAVNLTNDFKLKINSMAVLISSYEDQGDYAEALKLALQGLNGEDSTCEYCKINFASISDLYLKKNQLDSAQFFLLNALKYPPAPGLDGWIYSVAGRVYTELKNYDSAFKYYHKSIQTLKEENNLKDLAGTYKDLATLFLSLKIKDSSLLYAKSSLLVSQSKKFAKEIFETDLLLSRIYETVNSDSAFSYYKKAMIAKDSLYSQEKQRQIIGFKYKQDLQQQESENEKVQYKKQVKIYLLSGVIFIFSVIAFLLFRNNKHKQKANLLLLQQKGKVESTLQELKSTQAQLIQSEKMASLGELTAGIAHEIQNPLNFVNNFSEVNMELIEELQNKLKSGSTEEAVSISNDIKENEKKINHHGKRADAIVKGMLQHSKQTKGVKELTDINALCDEYLRLSYHGMRAKDKNFNATMKTDFDNSIGKINIIPQDIGRVLLNLYNNAFYAVNEQKNRNLNWYQPTVSVRTKKAGNHVIFTVSDNGNGISQKVLDKIFQPFFTTKPTGEGTGLGLSLSYDIVKAHGGEIKVESKEGEGSEFIIQLPVNE